MESAERSMRRLGLGNRWVAVLSALVLLSVSAISADSALHQFVHADAAQPDHQCAITVFAKAQVHPAAAGSVLSEFQPSFAFDLLIPEQVALISRPFLLPPSCGPPIPLD